MRQLYKYKLQELQLVENEALRHRLLFKLAHLEVDKFFFKKQLELFKSRVKFLQENSRYNLIEIAFLCIAMFEQAST